MHEFKNKKYADLLFDSLRAFDVASAMDGDASGSIYRASIISSLVSLECVANICIDELGLPSEIYSQIEKFPIQAKFEYFSHERFGRLLDKSRAEYGLLKALISLRNDYVHPKVEDGALIKEAFEVNYGIKKSMSFDNDIRKWGRNEASMVIDACIKFLNYFFVDVCILSKGVVTHILACREVLNVKEVEVFIQVGEEFNLLNHLSTKIDFLDLRHAQPT